MSETVKYKQMSIYDFLPEEKSQEVQPSETVPQVDEAQDESIYYVLDSKGNTREFSPSSDLDTRKTWEKIVDFEASLTKEPTEDTDSTLFSVGDKALVRNACEVYGGEDSEDVENYYALLDLQGKVVVISKVHPNGINIVADGIEFYSTELIKI